MSTTNIFILGRPFNGISEGVLPGNDSLEFTQFRVRLHAGRPEKQGIGLEVRPASDITEPAKVWAVSLLELGSTEWAADGEYCTGWPKTTA